MTSDRVRSDPAASRLDPAPFSRSAVAIGGGLFLALMAVSGRYGFHRDELYFLDCARHLQGGYVDQPLVAPLLARISLTLTGVSLPELRFWPAIAAWGTVIVAAATTRELGGTRQAQLMSALAVATMPVLLAVDHLEGPTSVDVLAWATLAWIVVRIGRTEQPTLWPWAGLVLGVGLANKHSIGLFAVAAVIGALASGAGRLMLNRWFAIGAGVAAICTLPDLGWQSQHAWATVAMTRVLHEQNGGAGNIPVFVVGQLLMSTIPLLPVWIAGIRFLWRAGIPLWRSLVWAWAILLVLFAVTTGAQIYYLAGAYVYLLAAGAVSLDRWWAEWSSRRRIVSVGVAGVAALLSLPLVLPVLPARDTGWMYAVNQVPGESVGWTQVVRRTARAWRALSAEQRRHGVVYTADYGEAGAINQLGPAYGLPGDVSAQNSEWWWGPGDPRATTVLAVAPGPRDVTGYATYLRRFFGSVRTVATFADRAGIHNEEWHGHVYVCTQPRQPWGRMWPRLRHYS